MIQILTGAIEKHFTNYEGGFSINHAPHLSYPLDGLLYGVFSDHGNTLRAFRVEKVFYGPENQVILRANVAGIGRCDFRNGNDFFATKEDFLAGRCIQALITDYIDTEEVIWNYGVVKKANTGYYCSTRLYRYAWGENKVKSACANFYIVYDVAFDSFNVVFPFDSEYKYASEADCIAANSLDVCEDFLNDGNDDDADVCDNFVELVARVQECQFLADFRKIQSFVITYEGGDAFCVSVAKNGTGHLFYFNRLSPKANDENFAKLQNTINF